MLLTKSNLDTATAFLTGGHNAVVAQKTLNASVMLRGAATGGSTFTGSATILGIGTEVAYADGKWSPTATKFTVIMTCKHSLYVRGNGGKVPDTGGTPKWNQDFVSSFASNINIFWSDGGNNAFGSNLTKSASIDHVVPVFDENIGTDTKMLNIPTDDSTDGAFVLVNLTGTTTADGSGSISGSGGISPSNEDTSWAYDVMLILSKDTNLYNFASTAGNCDYQAGVKEEGLYNLLNPNYGRGFAGSVPALVRSVVQLSQTGFGKVSEQLLPKGADEGDEKITLPAPPEGDLKAGAQYERLQYKLSTPTAQAELPTFYSELPGDSGDLTLANTHGFVLDADGGNNSTNSGDSGGGVFAFKANPTTATTAAYLVGVTTGSAVSARQSEAASMWDFDNNVATSLGLYYDKLFNLRFQNV